MSNPDGLMPKEELIAWLLASPVETRTEVSAAVNIASCALHGAKRRDGSDYIEHCLRVGMSQSESLAQKIIGILHDVVEETRNLSPAKVWALNDFRRIGFSKRIIAGLDGVTKRADEAYFKFIERCSLNPDSLAVKLSDLEDNSQGIDAPVYRNTWQKQKQKAYVASYYYLQAVKKGKIKPGTPMNDFMKLNPKLHDNNLLHIFNSHANSVTLKKDLSQRTLTP